MTEFYEIVLLDPISNFNNFINKHDYLKKTEENRNNSLKETKLTD